LDKGSTFSVVSELVNKLLDVTNLVFLTSLSFYGVFVLLGFSLFELLEVTFVVGQLLALEMNNFFASSV
jgi:hypothetical protein